MSELTSKKLSKPRPSLRASIDAMCKSCIYDPVAGKGTWRQQVEACTAPHCPLFAVRPLSASETDESEAA
jgi:hypothetical protein